MPTSQADQVAAATGENLYALWQSCLQRLGAMGIDTEMAGRQSFITPSCGTGSLTPELSHRVLELTRELSERVRHT